MSSEEAALLWHIALATQKAPMQARLRILNASYGPDTLRAMTQAFDQAWAVIAGNIDQDGHAAARLRLANVLLSVATEDSRNVEEMKRKALEAMALNYHAVSSDTANSYSAGDGKGSQESA